MSATGWTGAVVTPRESVSRRLAVIVASRRTRRQRTGPLATVPDEVLRVLASVRVVGPGQIACQRCNFVATWSGGARTRDARFGSESVGAYVTFAQHHCPAGD